MPFCLQEQRKRLARENAAAFEASLAAVVPSNAKHCVVPLESPIQTAVGKTAAFFKENRDISSGRNTLDSSQSDQYANKIGRLLGTKYPNGDCDVIVQNYINKHY